MAVKKIKLADVLWDAANKYLLPDNRFNASCCCAFEAEFGKEWIYVHDTWARAARQSKAVQFLKSLGCRVGAIGFRHFEEAEARQGVRYMWLLLAMHVAEDEGIEIEVQA